MTHLEDALKFGNVLTVLLSRLIGSDTVRVDIDLQSISDLPWYETPNPSPPTPHFLNHSAITL